MKLLLLGKNGQVGSALMPVLAPLGETVALGRAELDLADFDRVTAVLDELKPDVVVNAVAHTAVDRAESEPALARLVNTAVPERLAAAARRGGFLLVHYSTDYVFDGTKPAPYLESDPPAPISVYGRTKNDGDRAIIASGCAHLILRISWVHSPGFPSFVASVVTRARRGERITAVSDQVGAPTPAALIAAGTAAAIETGARGVYHLTASGSAGRDEIARYIVSLLPDPAPEVAAVPSSAFPTPARRPMNCRLDTHKFVSEVGMALPTWQEGVAETVRAMPG